MRFVDFQGVRGKGPIGFALLPYRLLRAFWQSAKAIRELRPDVVLGMGGYISFPGGMMASALNRPLAIHEQNSIAGTSTRLLAQVADRVLASFESTFGARRRVVVTGNPIRAAFTSLPSPQARFAQRTGPLRITVLGGSLGAKALNDVVPQALAAVPAPAPARFEAVDRYSGPPLAPGTASLTVRVTLEPDERTLTDDEIESYRRALAERVARDLGVRLRGEGSADEG